MYMACVFGYITEYAHTEMHTHTHQCLRVLMANKVLGERNARQIITCSFGAFDFIYLILIFFVTRLRFIAIHN